MHNATHAAARSVGSATVSFGLVSIPVKVYPATKPHAAGIAFNLLHKGCGSRLKQMYRCAAEGVTVEKEDIIKGYEFARDRYITFEPEELKALDAVSDDTISIAEFIDVRSVDPVYFDKPYYLGPDKGGAKAYSLLAETMRRTGRAALARHAVRGKLYLVLIRPVSDGLVMQNLLYADEVRAIADVPMSAAPLLDAELALAEQLVSSISTEGFHPERYRNEVRDRLEALVAKKVEGESITVSPTVPDSGKVLDIMEALRQSIAAQPKQEKQPDEKKKPASVTPIAPVVVRRRSKKKVVGGAA